MKRLILLVIVIFLNACKSVTPVGYLDVEVYYNPDREKTPVSIGLELSKDVEDRFYIDTEKATNIPIAAYRKSVEDAFESVFASTFYNLSKKYTDEDLKLVIFKITPSREVYEINYVTNRNGRIVPAYTNKAKFRVYSSLYKENKKLAEINFEVDSSKKSAGGRNNKVIFKDGLQLAMDTLLKHVLDHEKSSF